MPIFKLEQQKACQLTLKPDGFGDEAELRDIFAKNLEKILGVRFLEKEFQTPDGRIDTLGLDENNSPVIIEYKWKEKDDVLSQGLFYFKWLLKNKNHFELLAASHFGKTTIVSWDQPRVILIAQGFNRYIKDAVQTLKNVELKSYSLYEENILQINNEYSPVPEKATNPTKAAKIEFKSVKTDETISYDLKYHLGITSPEMQARMNKLRDMILHLPSVEEKLDQKSRITYRTTKSFAGFEFRKTWIQVLLKEPRYKEDTQELVKDITSNAWGYFGMFKFTQETDLNYLFMLIKASYDSTL